MRFWRLEAYDGSPGEDEPQVGAIIGLHESGDPGDLGIATHFNSATNEWVSARWVECEDPRQVSR